MTPGSLAVDVCKRFHVFSTCNVYSIIKVTFLHFITFVESIH